MHKEVWFPIIKWIFEVQAMRLYNWSFKNKTQKQKTKHQLKTRKNYNAYVRYIVCLFLNWAIPDLALSVRDNVSGRHCWSLTISCAVAVHCGKSSSIRLYRWGANFLMYSLILVDYCAKILNHLEIASK